MFKEGQKVIFTDRELITPPSFIAPQKNEIVEIKKFDLFGTIVLKNYEKDINGQLQYFTITCIKELEKPPGIFKKVKQFLKSKIKRK